MLILQSAWLESTARAVIAAIAATLRGSLPVREAVEEDKAANKRNGAAPATNNPALQPLEQAWKKGEPALQVIHHQGKGPKRPDKKEAFQDIDSLRSSGLRKPVNTRLKYTLMV